MLKIIRVSAILTTTFFVQACANNKVLHYKDGTEVHVVQCTGASWIGCLEKASAQCKSNGYDILERNVSKTSGFFSTTDNKELIIRCKGNANISSDNTSTIQLNTKVSAVNTETSSEKTTPAKTDSESTNTQK